MKQLSIHIVLLLLVAGTVFFVNLGDAKLWDRDEPRNAGCAAEMMARGDWIVPTFNNELRYQKPVLTYWFMMTAYWMFGTNEFAARFWSAILGLGTVLLTYLIGRRLFRPNVGLLAGIVLASTMMFDVASRAATPDSYLIFFSTLAIYFYIAATFRRDSVVDEETGQIVYGDLELVEDGNWFPTTWSAALPIYASMGVAVLAKGPVGLVIPTAIVGMFLLIMRLPAIQEETWEKQGWLGKLVLSCLRPFHPWHFLKTCWSMRPLTAIGIVLLISAPWYVMVGLKTDGDFLRIFFLSENFGRATTAFENHSGGIWYYPVALLLGFFPWSVFWLPLVIGIDRNLSRQSSARIPVVLLLCWAGVQVGLFSLASTKLPSYITPCYPALALITGWGLHQWTTKQSPTPEIWMKLAYSALALSGLLIAASLVYIGNKYLNQTYWLASFAAIPVIGGIAALLASIGNRRLLATTTVCVTSILFCVSFFGVGTKIVDQYQTSTEILNVVQGQHPDLPVATFGCMESSWVVYANRPIFELSMAPNTTKQTTKRKKWWAPKPRVTPENFLAEFGNAMFITTNEHLDQLRSRLPAGFDVVKKTSYFLHEQELILIAATPERLAQSETAAEANRLGNHREFGDRQSFQATQERDQQEGRKSTDSREKPLILR